ncbi:MAG TPA: Crp/Fnr family transcriptional regulator [Burkholderiales bacterium]|nr:Crp/Fnr family transcriptional regulator [Burkholderiales bacterium]
MFGDTGNRILDALPPSARRSFQRLLIDLSAGTHLFNQGDHLTHAFFPTTAVCSLVVELASGDKAETGTVGRDGFVGVALVLGTRISYSSGVIQVSGEAYRLAARHLIDLCKQHEPFRKALFGYTDFCLHLASRSVACNSFHSIAQRLARWLLFAHDRAGRNEFHLTHELLSAMAAATRPRVSQAAARLKAEGIIDYRRGKVRILDRKRLEAVSCECYEETERHLHSTRQ